MSQRMDRFAEPDNFGALAVEAALQDFNMLSVIFIE